MEREEFNKSERIVSEKLINELFTSGQSQSLAAFPLRAVYLLKPVAESVSSATHSSPSVQLLISVPKKKFHHAVDRNRAKRQLREAYRHHKALLASQVPAGHCLYLAFIWLSDQHVASAQIESRVVTLFKRIAKSVQQREQ
jgi:ribonuclease P protein component